MRRLFFMLTIILPAMAFMGCSDDEGDEYQTFFVYVYRQYEDAHENNPDEKEFVNDANVYLFESNEKNIDTQKSAESIANSSVLTYTDGTTSERAKYKIMNEPGIFNLEDVKNGDYILWVEYNFGYGVTYHSSKEISVNYDYRMETEEKIFVTSGEGYYRYQNW